MTDDTRTSTPRQRLLALEQVRIAAEKREQALGVVDVTTGVLGDRCVDAAIAGVPIDSIAEIAAVDPDAVRIWIGQS